MLYELPFVKFTYHVVPDGKPVSVNVALYVTSLNAIAFDILFPSTVNALLYDGEYIVLSVDTVYVYVPLVRYRLYDAPIIAPELIPFVKFTYHVVAVGNPVSVNVALYVTFENVIDSDTGAPLTVNVDLYDGEYAVLSVYTVYLYVPFVSLNAIVELVVLYELPFVKFTYHVVPDGKPVSVNVALYVTSLNAIACETFDPFIVNAPAYESGL